MAFAQTNFQANVQTNYAQVNDPTRDSSAETGPAQDYPQLQQFVEVRQRPAFFLLIPVEQQLRWEQALAVRRLLKDNFFNELDFVIHSQGGSIDAAYLIASMLRLHANKINACVPLCAKSAATLLCIGANQIFLDELAELGPLDPQLFVMENGRPGHYISALDPLKSLEDLRRFGIRVLRDTANLLLQSELDLSASECIALAADFVRVIDETLFTPFPSEQLGEFSRVLAMSERYGLKLLMATGQWQKPQAVEIIHQLVHGYPAHGYIIDYPELKNMGFPAMRFASDQLAAVEALFDLCLETEEIIVAYREPAGFVEGRAPGEVGRE